MAWEGSDGDESRRRIVESRRFPSQNAVRRRRKTDVIIGRAPAIAMAFGARTHISAERFAAFSPAARHGGLANRARLRPRAAA